MNNSQYSSARVAGREHIPLYPNNFIALRIVQLVIAVIILGLSAYGVAGAAFDGDIFIMVVAIMTMIVTIYYIVSEFGAPAIYNYWAVLALDIFLVIMWIASMGLLASWMSLIYTPTTSYDYWTDTYVTYSSFGDVAKAWSACLAAACGLGGLEFVLFIVSLSIHGVMLHRHRKAGLHCTPGAAAPPPAAVENKQVQPTYSAAPAQQYAAPQYTQTPPPQQAYAVPATQYPVQQYQQQA